MIKTFPNDISNLYIEICIRICRLTGLLPAGHDQAFTFQLQAVRYLCVINEHQLIWGVFTVLPYFLHWCQHDVPQCACQSGSNKMYELVHVLPEWSIGAQLGFILLLSLPALPWSPWGVDSFCERYLCSADPQLWHQDLPASQMLWRAYKHLGVSFIAVSLPRRRRSRA